MGWLGTSSRQAWGALKHVIVQYKIVLAYALPAAGVKQEESTALMVLGFLQRLRARRPHDPGLELLMEAPLAQSQLVCAKIWISDNAAE